MLDLTPISLADLVPAVQEPGGRELQRSMIESFSWLSVLVNQAGYGA
ncbi:MAG: hypothetical protein GY768_07430 [Planctomycetaceae bacterium]|nr:hypothetical protein [Planctomycetaceae bacterium]